MITAGLETLAQWLVAVYLLSTALLVVGGAWLIRLRQPAQRLAVARSVTAGLAVLAVLAATPGWPRAGRVQPIPGEVAPIVRTTSRRVETDATTTRSRVRDDMDMESSV